MADTAQLNMRESRSQRISGRRFGRQDLLRIAEIFERAGGDEHRRLNFLVAANDGTIYESDSSRMFDDGSEALLKRPVLVEMSSSGFDSQHDLRFSATHTGSRADSLRVSGDPGWVRQWFMTLVEGIEAAPTTRHWITAHPRLVRHIAALGLGSLVGLLLDALMFLYFGAFGPPSPEFVAALRSSPVAWPLVWLVTHPAAYFLWSWVWRWFMGSGVWFLGVGKWFLSAYPDVDLDFGPDHLKRDKLLRDRLAFLGTAVALPLVIALAYDLLKPSLFGPR